MPEEQRTAIVLKEYHGLTFQEIADLVGCPLSTVKTRLYQGLTVLRRELARAVDDGMTDTACMFRIAATKRWSRISTARSSPSHARSMCILVVRTCAAASSTRCGRAELSRAMGAAGTRASSDVSTGPRASPAACVGVAEIPAWAQVAAALLLLGVSVGVSAGSRTSTFASTRAASDSHGLDARPATVPRRRAGGHTWRATRHGALTWRRSSSAAGRARIPVQPPLGGGRGGTARRQRRSAAPCPSLVAESESGQQRELALRVGELVDVQAQRRPIW